MTRRLPRRSLLLAAAAWPLLAAHPRPGHAAAPPPDAATALIGTYQAALLDVMRRAENLGPGGRAEALDGPVRATFAFDRMARAAAGKAWRAADAATRAAMVESFASYSVAVHADRFDGFSGESFAIDGTAPGPAGTTLVNTRIVRPADDDVPITYVVADTADGARVVDVLLEGSISEVALRRSEWASIGARDGLPGLIAALDRQAETLLAKG
ncbi:ABC transporter substrate-binding protein [Roseospira goensis]|uniref:Phospholipid transport system substrate-binding protein n=1 Tax=Roseospira goensis TaxID=391922 RepID=A0A7W6RYE9_9PROT|nr:ABC transporter substrate-binding protein [Roseospira goensis]MBB4285531.1 phospholipid transport system substrate-binding protein [Roseospira goensis]